ncbi:MAG: hypothetical protein ACE5FP_03445 [Gemmatimonadota bacterium]
MSLTVAEIRDRAERLHAALAEEVFEARAGRKAWSQLRPLYASQSVLEFSTSMPVIQRDLASAGGDEFRCLERLLGWVAEHHVRSANAELDDEFEQWAASVTMPHAGSSIPVRTLPSLIGTTNDRSARRELDALRSEALADALPLQLDRLNRWRTASVELGFGEYRHAMQRLTGLNLVVVSREGRRFVEDTNDLYFDSLERYLSKYLSLTRSDAESHDAMWLGRQSWADGMCNEAAILETVGGDLRDIGLPLEADGRIELAIEAFPSPGMRPSCAAIHVPDRIQLFVTPTTSAPGCRTLLREIGRALHWAYTSPRLPFELRTLGDGSVVDAHATLFGGLGRSSSWIGRAQGIDGDALGEYVRFAAFLELYAVRRMVARLTFDIELSQSERPGALGPRWAELMLEITGFRHDPRAFLAELGQRFGVARRLRARMLAALLARELKSRFDDDWYRNPRTGPYLGDWLAGGLTYDARELAVKLGAQSLVSDELGASIRRRLEG